MRYTIFTLMMGLVVCFTTQAQYHENFDNGIPVSWTKTYLLNNVPNTNPQAVPQWEDVPSNFQALICQGNGAAYVGRQNIGQGNITQSWLISPQIEIPTNGRLQFTALQTLGADFGTIYQVRVSTLGVSVTDFDAPILSLSENELSTVNTCKIHGIDPIIDLSAYAGQHVHIAFIKIDSQPSVGVNADRWILDDVRVYAQCNTPTNLNATTDNTTANLTWEANGTNSWQVVLVEGQNSPSDNMIDYTVNTNELLITDLTQNTHYTVYIRANCAGSESQWSEAYSFLTKNCDTQSCTYTFLLNDFYGDGWNGNTLSVLQDGIEIAVLTMTYGESAQFEISLCHGKNLSLFWNNDGEFHHEVSFSVLNPYNELVMEKPKNEGIPGTEVFNGTVNCTPPTCPNVSNVEIVSFNNTEAILQWTELGNATSWEVIVQPVGTGMPSTTTPIIANTIPFTVQNLNSLTQYEVFVRPICTNETSQWIGGNSFTTMLCHPDNQCVYNFKMTSLSSAGWGSNVMHVIQNNQVLHVLSLEHSDNQTLQLPLCQGMPFSIFWVDQGWAGSIVGLEVTDTTDAIIFSKPFGQGVKGTTIFELENTCQPLSCPNPQQIVFSNITQNSMTISWTEMGDANLWEYVLIPANTNLTPGIPFTQTITNTVTVNNLLPSTNYMLYLRSVCDLDDVSNIITANQTTIPTPPIVVNTTQYTVPELVTEVLFNSSCANIENISWRTGTNFDSENGIGYFEKAESSFGFLNGVVLSTGDVMNVPGPKTDSNSSGSTSWEGDDDLLALVPNNITNSQLYNATVLEFDFTAVSDRLSFDFIFASDEYGEYQCFYSDIFAFLLTDTQTNTTTNLAVIPNTDIPISATTIRSYLYNNNCVSENEEYFDVFYDGISYASFSAPINFSGSVVPLTASATLVPNRKYHIKLAIADFDDSIRDSAVFILGGSFNVGEVFLGEDLLITTNNALCVEQDYTIIAQIPNNTIDYQISWYHNGNLLTGENSPSLSITQAGAYSIELYAQGSTCVISDTINVEYYPDLNTTIQNPKDISICSQGTIFDLSENTSHILNTTSNPEIYTISYHTSVSDAEHYINPIANPEAFDGQTGQTIWVRISQDNNPCVLIKSFILLLQNPSQAQTNFSYQQSLYCSSGQNPVIVLSNNFTHGGIFSITPNVSGFDSTSGAIDLSLIPQGTYTITYTVADTDCIAGNSSSFMLDIVENCLIPRGISPNDDGYNDTFDLSFIHIKQLYIYNRYGKEVYSQSDYTNHWKGQDNKGRMLPDGTYYYVIEKTNGENLSGWVYKNGAY